VTDNQEGEQGMFFLKNPLDSLWCTVCANGSPLPRPLNRGRLAMEFAHYALGRWVHIGAGVMWIGLLYYFNFVNAAAAKPAAADDAAVGISSVMPRALLFFRWAAVINWIGGASLLGAHFLDAFLFQSKAYVTDRCGRMVGHDHVVQRLGAHLAESAEDPRHETCGR
jgi:hypothetical protein